MNGFLQSFHPGILTGSDAGKNGLTLRSRINPVDASGLPLGMFVINNAMLKARRFPHRHFSKSNVAGPSTQGSLRKVNGNDFFI
jgi:hypothetical protein